MADYRIRKIDIRAYGNHMLEKLYDHIYVVEQKTYIRKSWWSGEVKEQWVRVGSGLSLAVAERELAKLIENHAKRPIAEPVIVKEIHVED